MRSSVIAIVLALGLCGLYFIEILYEEADEDLLNYYINMNESSKGKNEQAKMDWMYRDSSKIVDREEYLLGRKVDKQFEKNMLPNDKDRGCLPSSIFSKTVECQVDVARKLQEDPLYLIQKKEIESREQLLKNPRKMKQLQEMVARQQAAAEKLKKKEIKRKKKMQLDSLLVKKCKLLFGSVDIKKLTALSSASESSSDGDKKESKNNQSLDELIAAKYKKLLGNIDAKDLKEMDSSSDSDIGFQADKQRRRSRSSSSDYKKNKSKSEDRRTSHSNRHADNGRERPESKYRKKREFHDKSSSENDNVQGKEKLSLKDKKLTSKMYSADKDIPYSKYKSHASNNKSKSHERRKSSSESSDSSSDNSCTSNKKYSKKIKGKYNQDSVKGKCPSNNDGRNVKERGKKEKERKKYRSNSGSSSEDSASSKKGQQRKQYGLVLPVNYVPKEKPNEDNKPKVNEDTSQKPVKKEPKRKLTEKEKELRLKEMMSNAKWREELRDKNIKSHNEKLKAEKDDYVYNEDFMRKQMALAVSQGTVESRVKAKINSIQRGGSSMNENFARRH